jgi:hypothetical protein
VDEQGRVLTLDDVVDLAPYRGLSAEPLASRVAALQGALSGPAVARPQTETALAQTAPGMERQCEGWPEVLLARRVVCEVRQPGLNSFDSLKVIRISYPEDFCGRGQRVD